MKKIKIFSLVLALVLALCGCGGSEEEKMGESVSGGAKTEEGSPVMSEEPKEESKTEEQTESDKPDENNNADVPTGETKLYYCTDTAGDLNVTYHLKECSLIHGKEVMEINSDFVKMIGLNRCSTCNPPEYKN